MARPEPKLRPSIAVSDMVLLSKVLETDILRRIQAGNKGLETLQVAKLKEYIDSFKPTEIVLSDILAKYTQASGVATTINMEPSQASAQELDLSALATNNVESVSILNDASLTDEQKFDLLSLVPSKDYSPEEIEFMNSVGFSIKLSRMTKTPVNESEL